MRSAGTWMLGAVLILPLWVGVAQAARGSRVVTCESQDRRLTNCAVDTGRGVELLEQHSKAMCTENQSWGYGPYGIWVSAGCKADFLILDGYRRDERPRRDWDPREGRGRSEPAHGRDRGRGLAGGYTVVCESSGRRRVHCPARIDHGVELQLQLSDAECEEGYSWGTDTRGIWVSRGCRGEFRVD